MTRLPATKEEILQYLLKFPQVTAQDLAEALGLSPQAIRRHLKDLELDNFVEYQIVQEGRGRPQYRYCLSKQGHEYFPNGYNEFAVSFLDTLVETVGEQQVGEVLRKQWERKADEYRQSLGSGSLFKRVTKLVELRRQEGYMAELHCLEQKTPEKYILAEHNCAISDVAESYPTVCGHELEMFAAILPDCSVERTQWMNQEGHTCGYLITGNQT